MTEQDKKYPAILNPETGESRVLLENQTLILDCGEKAIRDVVTYSPEGWPTRQASFASPDSDPSPIISPIPKLGEWGPAKHRETDETL